MGFDAKERAVLLAAPSIGPKMVGYLEAAGISTLSALATCEALQLAAEINHYIGRPHINKTGMAALGNAIHAAKSAQ